MTMDYQALIALAKRQKNIGPLVGATAHGFATNASCGDSCDVWIRVEGDAVSAVTYEARGCVMSRAAAAILAESVLGSLNQIKRMDGQTMRELLHVDVSPLRERCLTTALKALQNAVSSL
jgi:nitrogen fixation protein NifU and related proteins